MAINFRPRYRIKIRYVLAAASVSALVCVSALRANNLQMVKLREAVYAADKANGNVAAALTALQQYVTGHMNTDLTPQGTAVYPPIQLKYTYERLQAARGDTTGNDQIYSDAQTYCEAQDGTDFSGRNRVPCIQQYVESHNATVPQAIPDSLYKFDFLSPSWSPDLAGWTTVSTLLLVVVAVLLLVKRYIFDKLRKK